MQAKHLLRTARWDPSILAASLTANLLGLAIPLSMIQIYDRVIPNDGRETLTALALMVLLAILMEALLKLARAQLLARAAQRYEHLAYTTALAAILSEDPARATAANQGRRFTQLTGIDRLRDFHLGDAATSLLDLPFALLFLGIIVLISPVAGLTVASLLGLCFFIVRFERTRILKLQVERQDIEGRRHSFVMETLRGMDVVKSLGIEDFMARRYERLLIGSARVSAALSERVLTAQGFVAATGALAPMLTACAGAFLVIQGQMSVGGLAAIIILTGRVVQPVLRVEAFIAGAEHAKHARKDVADIMTIPARPQGDLSLDRIETLELSDVHTRLDSRYRVGFRGLDLTLRTGDCVLLTGPGQAGGKALLRMLAGELAIGAGTYAANGRPWESYRLEDRLQRLRLLSSEASLLEGTLLDNMTLFQPARYRDDAVVLAGALGLDKFVAHTPEGLSMQVGSGAQNRLAKSIADSVTIVAGLVTHPDVILFDEANTGLDRQTDERLQRWLAAERANRIVVMISHRPSYQKLATRHVDLTDFVTTDGATQTGSAPTRREDAA